MPKQVQLSCPSMGGAKLRTGKSLREAGSGVDREVCTLNVEVMYNSCMNWAEPIPKHEDAGANRDSPFTAETRRTQRKRREEQRERKDQDSRVRRGRRSEERRVGKVWVSRSLV